MSSQMFYGSICLTDLIEKAKEKHSAFTKGDNGKIYASATVWLNEEKDKYGNILAVQITPSKEKKDVEKKFYIGNFKKSDGAKPISDRDASNLDVDIDAKSPSVASDISDPSSDLPF